MSIEYINDTGSRHEWRYVHSDDHFLVTFHYLDETWSVQRIRTDGEREILDRREAKQLLSQFPRERALKLIAAEPSATRAVEQPGKLDIDSATKQSGERGVSFGPSTRQEKDDDADTDSSQPAA